MDARILNKLLQDFETMSVEEYRELHAQAVARSEKVQETILVEDIDNCLVKNPVHVTPTNIIIDVGMLGSSYVSYVNSVYVSYKEDTITSPHGENSCPIAA